MDSEDSLSAAAVTEDADDALWSPCMTSDGHGLIMWKNNTSVWDQTN
jgi:hypothetical protein